MSLFIDVTESHNFPELIPGQLKTETSVHGLGWSRRVPAVVAGGAAVSTGLQGDVAVKSKHTPKIFIFCKCIFPSFKILIYFLLEIPTFRSIVINNFKHCPCRWWSRRHVAANVAQHESTWCLYLWSIATDSVLADDVLSQSGFDEVTKAKN